MIELYRYYRFNEIKIRVIIINLFFYIFLISGLNLSVKRCEILIGLLFYKWKRIKIAEFAIFCKSIYIFKTLIVVIYAHFDRLRPNPKIRFIKVSCCYNQLNAIKAFDL